MQELKLSWGVWRYRDGIVRKLPVNLLNSSDVSFRAFEIFGLNRIAVQFYLHVVM